MSRQDPIEATDEDNCYSADEAEDAVFGCDDLLPPPVNEENNIYRVESIVGIARTTTGVVYRVKWFGYPLAQATWEPESEMGDCWEAVAAFRKRYAQLLVVRLGMHD
jgi:hypothetical protein